MLQSDFSTFFCVGIHLVICSVFSETFHNLVAIGIVNVKLAGKGKCLVGWQWRNGNGGQRNLFYFCQLKVAINAEVRGARLSVS